MRSRERAVLQWVPLAAASLVFALPSDAEIRTSQFIPTFTGTDLNGTDHSSLDFRNGPLLVVLITTRAAGDGLRNWNNSFDARYGTRISRYSLVSIDIPFFVAHATVRSRARNETPQAFWTRTWISMHDEFEEAFGVEESPEPWAMVLNRDGRITTVVHGFPSSPEAINIWRALDAAH